MDQGQQSMDDSWDSQDGMSDSVSEHPDFRSAKSSPAGDDASPSVTPPQSAQSQESPAGYTAYRSQSQSQGQPEPGDEGEDEAPIILITTVDIGGGRSDRIQVRAGENTLDVARHFCERHGLPEEVIKPLSKHLLDNLAAQGGKSGSKGKKKAKGRKSSRDSAGGGSSRATDVFDRLYLTEQTRLQSLERQSREREHQEKAAPKAARRPGPPVHERLYALHEEQATKREFRAAQQEADEAAELEAQREHISWVSRELAAARSVGEYLNYGERLYVEGLVERERKSQEAQSRRHEAEIEELKEVTFKPEISKIAKNIRRPADMSTWERLNNGFSNQKMMLEARKEMQRQEDAMKEVEECTFRPNINKKSEKMMNRRTEVLREHRVTAHEQLFQDAIRRQLRQDEYTNWCPEEVTFQPAINSPTAWRRASSSHARWQSKSSASKKKAAAPPGSAKSTPGQQMTVDAWAAAARGASASRPNSGVRGQPPPEVILKTPAFAERLYRDKDRRERHLAEIADSLAPTFKPKTGRAPAQGRNRNGLSIGDYLYGKHHEMQGKREYLSEQLRQEVAQESTKTFTTQHSEALMDKLKKRRFGQIFRFLDTDDEEAADLVGIAVSESDLLEHLDPEVRADVVEAARLLQERRDAFARRCELDRSMSADEIPEVLLVDAEGFAALMDEVLRTSPWRPRSYLQPAPSSSRLEKPEYNYKPTLDPKSKAMAAKRRPEHIPVHDAILQEWHQNQYKREVKKAEKEQQEMKECTFEPKLVSEQLSSNGRAVQRPDPFLSAPQSGRQEGQETLMFSSRILTPESPVSSPRKRMSKRTSGGAENIMVLAGLPRCSQLEVEDELLEKLEASSGVDYAKLEQDVQRMLRETALQSPSPSQPTAHPKLAKRSLATPPTPEWHLEPVLGSDTEDEGTPASVRGWTPGPVPELGSACRRAITGL